MRVDLRVVHVLRVAGAVADHVPAVPAVDVHWLDSPTQGLGASRPQGSVVVVASPPTPLPPVTECDADADASCVIDRMIAVRDGAVALAYISAETKAAQGCADYTRGAARLAAANALRDAFQPALLSLARAAAACTAEVPCVQREFVRMAAGAPDALMVMENRFPFVVLYRCCEGLFQLVLSTASHHEGLFGTVCVALAVRLLHSLSLQRSLVLYKHTQTHTDTDTDTYSHICMTTKRPPPTQAPPLSAHRALVHAHPFNSTSPA